jgi:hypothetical protein
MAEKKMTQAQAMNYKAIFQVTSFVLAFGVLLAFGLYLICHSGAF